MAHKHHTLWTAILGWFIANLLAVVFVAFASLMHLPALPGRGGMLVASLVIGFPIGLAQWIALRRAAPISPLWILSVSVALPLGLVIVNSPMFLGAFGSLGDESIIAIVMAYAVIGLVVGLIQWVLMWGHFAKHYFWPLISSAGLGLGMGLVLALINPSGIAPIILGVLIYTIATGSVVSWMLASGGEHEAALPSAS